MFSKFNQLLGKYDYAKNCEFIERFYINKYGSREKAELIFKQLKEGSKDEATFQLILQEKIEKDLHLREIENFLKPFMKVQGITGLLKKMFYLKKLIRSKKLKYSTERIIEDCIELIKPAFEETFVYSDERKKDILNYLNQNVTLNLKNTRKELGYPDPRTFNYWLRFFFNSKFDDKTNENKSKNSGKLTLFEYIEIVSAFILSYNENELKILKPKEILRRFELQQKTQKQVLKELTDNNFSKLKEKLEDLHYSKEYQNKYGNQPFNITKRKIPYSLVSIIKEHIKHGYLN